MNKRLWQEALAHKRPLLWAAGLNIGGSVLAIGQAFCFAYIINGIFLENNTAYGLIDWFYGLLFLAAVRAVVSYWADTKAHEFTSLIKINLRKKVSGKIFELGPVSLAEVPAGSLTNLLNEGIENIEPYFSRFLPQLFQTATVPLFTLALVFYLNKAAFFIMLITVPLIPAFMVLIGKSAREKSNAQLAKLSAMSAHFLDVLQGLPTLKLFGRSKEQAGVIARIAEEFQSGALDILKIAFLSALSLELIATISTALIAVTVGLELLYGYSMFFEAFLVLLLTPGFYLPFRQLGVHYHSAGEALAAVEKIYALLDKDIEEQADISLDFKKTKDINISFEKVSFSYAGGGGAALNEVSFQMNAGEKIALIGPSGAGKSTIVSLLLKFANCRSGAIMVNGLPLAQLKKSDWLANIAYVPQQPHLFAASVADNIRFGCAAPLQAVINAAQKAQIHDFICSLPDGYETIIGEGGRGLSGGEAQRLAIARAFLREAGLVIFDEAITAVDIQNQLVITEAIRNIFPDSTLLIITHCLKTITACDRVIVLQNGRIAEQEFRNQT